MLRLSNKPLLVLFIALVGVSVYLLYHGYEDVNRSHIRAKALIAEQHAKDSHLSTMYTSARERSLILLSMMEEEDPFELDDLNQEMGGNARAFIKARIALMSLPLSDEERAIILEQNEITSVNAPLQDQVAQLFIEGRRDEAKQLLFDSAMPGQALVLKKINDFIRLHKSNTIRTVANIDENFENARRHFRVLGGLLLGSSAIFIVFVVLVSRQEQQRLQTLLEEQKKISNELDQAAEKLSYQASHDSLTGLLSRREFEKRVHQLLQRADEGNTHAVMYLDLDQFKIVNDTCGHQAGDTMLKEVAVIMHGCIRKSDALARLGGDEFGVLLEYCELDQARSVAQEIIDKINEFRFTWEKKRFRLGVSIGMTMVDNHARGVDDIMVEVDSACFAAKDAGRNRYHLYDQTDKQLAIRESEMSWIVRLERAHEKNHFVLYAQPIMPSTIQSSAVPCYEILIRLKGEDGQIILPGAFLPAAERYDRMIDIDRWVVHQTLSMLSEHPGVVENMGYCSINISCQSLTDAGFMSFLVNEISMYEGLAEHICLEITETAAINSMIQAVRSISILRGIGVRFALDDFGSGLSSFGYLKSLPIDYLKIDGMFVRDMLEDPIDRAMVKAIHDIATIMGKKTIAEYVESKEIIDELKDIGVHYVQGYAVGYPVPFEEVLDAATSRRPIASSM